MMIPDFIWFIQTHHENQPYTTRGGGVCVDPRGYIVTVAHILCLKIPEDEEVPQDEEEVEVSQDEEEVPQDEEEVEVSQDEEEVPEPMYSGRTHTGRLVPLELIHISPNMDLAVLQVKNRDEKTFAFVRLVDLPLKIDEPVFAYIHQSDLVYTKKEGITCYPFPCGEDNRFPDLEDQKTILSEGLVHNNSRNFGWEPFRTLLSIVEMTDPNLFDGHPHLPLIQVKGFGVGFTKDHGMSGCPAFRRNDDAFIGIFNISKLHFQYLIPVHFLRIYATQFVPPHTPSLPQVFADFSIKDGDKSSAAGNPDEVAKLFPCVFGQPSSIMVRSESEGLSSAQKLKIGVVLSGGQAPGGHNVIWGIFDYLQARAKGSTIYGFIDGPAGIMKCKYVELTSYFLHPYRIQGGLDMICSGTDRIETPEQFNQAVDTAVKLDLDGLVVIGGDDSNTDACLLAETFRFKKLKACVIVCPNTIDGDHQSKEVPTSFGFDTACKIYAERIGEVMIAARSTGKYYHFIRLMGRAASHITLECALQTHPNISLIGEEVFAKKQSLKNVTDYMVDIICKRAESGFNYGVILIPEGLIDFIPVVEELITELNEILAHEVVDEAGLWKKNLTPQSVELFDLLPQAIQEQLMLERDPHANVQVAKIETEKMLMQMVETELEKRREQGSYKGQFKGKSHFFEFFGNEGRCGLPANFDSSYYYALGYAAGALLRAGKTGLISSVGNLAAPVEEWTVGGTALTSLLDVERRHGKFKPVIKKAMVELEGAAFKKFASMRDKWANNN